MRHIYGDGFDQIRNQVLQFTWNSHFKVSEIPSPKKIAPYSMAIEADINDSANENIGSGRLVLLHDPQGNTAWDGTSRAVSYVQADVDLEMVLDPLLPEVGWTWLKDALESQDAKYHATSGTVTSVASRGFGELADEPDRAEIEIRSSWTIDLDDRGIDPHLGAWQELLRTTAGLPPLASGIVPITFKANQ